MNGLATDLSLMNGVAMARVNARQIVFLQVASWIIVLLFQIEVFL